MKKALIIIAIVAIVAITGVLIYYYAFFRPANERAKLDWEKEKYQEEINQEKLEASKERLEEIEREMQLHDCLDCAYEDYQNQWDKEVKRLDSKDNALPMDIADRLNEIYKYDREECIKLYGSDQ